MKIRQAEVKDIIAIGEFYEAVLLHEEKCGGASNWKRGLYPTVKVPEEKVPQGMMYVIEEKGEILAAMVLNQEQLPEYAEIPWQYAAEPKEVFVIHTLAVHPKAAGQGLARQMIAFAKAFAKEKGARVLRIDTYAGNTPAKNLYIRNGFRLAGTAESLFMGVIPETLAMLECLL